MDTYLSTYSHLTNQMLDCIQDIQELEKSVDRLYKINLYLLRKYKDNLIKEFNIEIPEGVFEDPWFKLLETTFNQKVNREDETLILSLIINKIDEEMQKEMPDPWYCYGFGSSKTTL